MLLRFLALFALCTSFAWGQAAIEAPASVRAGMDAVLNISGAANPRDFVTVVPKGSHEGFYTDYQYAGKGGALKVRMPAKPGDYEIRLMAAAPPYATLARRALKIEAETIALEAPAQVAAGAPIELKWSGPNNPGDYVGIGEVAAKGAPYLTYVLTARGNPARLQAPDQPGDYELRYFLAAGNTVAGSRRITVTPASASLQGPAEAVSGTGISVNWQGPNNAEDYVTIVGRGEAEGASGNFVRTARGNPAVLAAPVAPGDYELRYATGQAHVTLARTPIRIVPGKQEPGMVAVTASPAVGQGAVEVILDASGSMLLRIGAQTRIDIAKQTLGRLVSSAIPAGTPFAFRVFGREVNSCQTDLDIPLGPLDPKTVQARLAALQVKNMARTPIGASLEKVASDLAAAKGERLVILLTDGEETCGGDPSAAIAKLNAAGIGLRLNIVGFAIDDKRLDASFRHWAQAGNGSYFSARDAAGLSDALANAMRPGFEVVTAQGQVVAEGLAGGEPVRVMPGSYSVRLKGRADRTLPVSVKSRETASAKF